MADLTDADLSDAELKCADLAHACLKLTYLGGADLEDADLSEAKLLCCSEDSLTSWWVKDEIDKALEKERKLRDDRGEDVLAVIPLNLDGFLFDGWQDGRATSIRKRLAADFTGWESDNQKFADQFEKVVQALRTERELAPESKL